MLALPGKYFVLASKSWGRAVSGPVLAIAGLALLVMQQTSKKGLPAYIASKWGPWITLGIAVLMMFVAQYKVWKQEQESRIKAEEDLNKRLVPKAIIRNLTPRIWPVGKGGFTGKEYYFDVFNSSEAESLENVRVEVVEIVPDAIGYPNAPLHVRNDDYNTREFSINPRSVRQIDLITGPVNAPCSQTAMIIAHTVNGQRTEIPYGRYLITVRVSARNTRAVTAEFEAWIEEGELRCEAL